MTDGGTIYAILWVLLVLIIFGACIADGVRERRIQKAVDARYRAIEQEAIERRKALK